ncbi:hypothetical protein [Parasphingorhabdus pacifica]
MTGPKTDDRSVTRTASRDERDKPIPPDLADALKAGPFEVALRTAIRASRLSLERIQHRLRTRGTPVSITALSYWQSGRRRPERPDSLLALQQLEDVLGLPDGALSALLGPPRPRGRTRQVANDAPPLSALWSENESAVELLNELDTSHDGKLTRLSHHDVIHVDAHGNQRKVRVRKLIRAECNGADRWIVMFDGASSAELAPTIRPIRACRLGQVYTDHARDVIVAELLFDRPLERSETLLMEYEIVELPTGANEVDYSFCRLFRLPVRQYVLEVQFDPASPPTHCESYVGDSAAQDVEPPKPMTLDSFGRTHAVALDFGMGVFGVRWHPSLGPVLEAP